MSPEERAAIRARCEAATAGPWAHSSTELWACVATPTHLGQQVCSVAGSEPDVVRATAAFIAAARTDVPALLAEVERLEALIEAETDHRISAVESTRRVEAERDNLAQSADLLKAVAERAGAERDAALVDAARLRAALAAIAGETSVLVRSDGSATRNGDRLTMTRSLCDIRDTARAALESK